MRRIYRDASLRLLSDLVELSRGGNDPDGRGELDADYRLVRRAAESSACLFRSLRLGRWLSRIKERPAAHAVLVAQEEGLGAPVEALAQLLAASIAGQFGDAAVAVTFVGKVATAHVWIGSELVHTGRVASYEKLLDVVEAILRKRAGAGSRHFFHVIVAAGASPADIPAGFRAPTRPKWVPRRRESSARDTGGKPAVGYDRVVFLAEGIPDSAPEDWVNLLAEAVRPLRGDGKHFDPLGPYFSSFVVTVVPTRADKIVEPPKFETKAVDLELQTATSKRDVQPPGWRLWRDACRLPVKMQALEGLWKPSEDADGSAARTFVEAQRKATAVAPFIDRWARAVTNRQVGVALSGGGASSYRLVPLLRDLHHAEVPIDVVSGISGGALLGAYYCALGTEGLDLCIKRGREFQWAMVTAIYQPNHVRDVVNKDLKSVAIDATNVRFAAITTALLKETPPQTRMVTAGTLGEAAQASGAAPLLFVPVRVDDERFSDGASASLIPVRILKDCGADFVFAFNCLPGPPRRNPIDHRPGGETLYERTLLGRLIDLWVSAGSMVQRVSREACEDAHVFFEPTENKLFLIESVQFYNASKIAQEMGNVKEAIEDCKNTWQRLRLGGLTMNGWSPGAGTLRGRATPRRPAGARNRSRTAKKEKAKSLRR